MSSNSAGERVQGFKQFISEQEELLTRKGADYTAGRKGEDADWNFRAIADLLRDAPTTPYTVALVYFLKHVFSLITFCKTGKQESTEPIHGRHLDVANYAFILDRLVHDHIESVAINESLSDMEVDEFMRGEAVNEFMHTWVDSHTNEEEPPPPGDEDYYIPFADQIGSGVLMKVRNEKGEWKNGEWETVEQYLKRKEGETANDTTQCNTSNEWPINTNNN